MGWEAIVAALIAAAAGTYGTYSANKATNAQLEGQAQSERAERFRQAELQRQADAKVREGIQQFTPEKQQQDIAQAVDTRAAALSPQAPAPNQYQASTVAAPVEVKNDLERRLGDVAGRGRDEAMRRARLGAFGDVSQGEGFQLGRLGENLRQLTLQSRGDSSIFPYDLREQANRANPYGRRADLANTIGTIGSLYAMSAKPKPAPAGYGSIDATQSGYPVI